MATPAGKHGRLLTAEIPGAVGIADATIPKLLGHLQSSLIPLIPSAAGVVIGWGQRIRRRLRLWCSRSLRIHNHSDIWGIVASKTSCARSLPSCTWNMPLAKKITKGSAERCN